MRAAIMYSCDRICTRTHGDPALSAPPAGGRARTWICLMSLTDGNWITISCGHSQNLCGVSGARGGGVQRAGARARTASTSTRARWGPTRRARTPESRPRWMRRTPPERGASGGCRRPAGTRALKGMRGEVPPAAAIAPSRTQKPTANHTAATTGSIHPTSGDALPSTNCLQVRLIPLPSTLSRGTPPWCQRNVGTCGRATKRRAGSTAARLRANTTHCLSFDPSADLRPTQEPVVVSARRGRRTRSRFAAAAASAARARR